MVESTDLQILLGFYAGTVALNILVVTIQYLSVRDPIYPTLLFYWLGLMVTVIANSLVVGPGVLMVAVTFVGAFVSHMFLADFFSKVRDVRLPVFQLGAVFMVSLILSGGLFLAGLPITVYAYPVVIAAVLPLLTVHYIAFKKRARPYSSVQRMLTFVMLMMSFHYLDWPIARPIEGLVFPGMILAFVLAYLLGILTTMAGNESSLQKRNEQLAYEVEKRAKQLNEAAYQLWETSRMASLGRMAGGVAHEVNTPLAALSLQLEVLQGKARRGELKLEDIEIETKAALQVIGRIAHVTGALRKVAKDIEAGGVKLVSICELVDSAVAACRVRLDLSGIRLSVDCRRGEGRLNCNAMELSEVILNLLINSIDAVEECAVREIAIRLDETESKVLLSVEDSGYLDPAIGKQLMDPFFTTKALGKGTGLGLSVSRSIAEHHGGALYWDEKSPRTRFVLELPKKADQNLESRV